MVIPTIVVSYVFSFFWSCLFEIPIVKLEKMLTDGLLPKKPVDKPKPSANGNAELEKGVTTVVKEDADGGATGNNEGAASKTGETPILEAVQAKQEV
ncbi:unnamed protein product [Strongylus vulgaris]|uniref:Uncharacterized protein n=1 Tax=Strongylus vulgaris TaxID=40348 RepID=A0A3P7J3G8_STRVU|nr:unnamed protein product [Strongylus vulgaris]